MNYDRQDDEVLENVIPESENKSEAVVGGF